MAQAVIATPQQPMSELNTTPLIDVLLVLLILLVVTIPPATHSLEVPLPAPSAKPPPLPIDPVRNTLSIDPRGVVRWNGAATSESELLVLLSDSTRLKPEPELRFQPDGAAPYEKSLRVLRLVKTAGVTAFGFVGIDQYAGFERAP